MFFFLQSFKNSIIQEYKDIYSPVTLRRAQEFVLVTFHSYSALTYRQDIAISHI